MSIKAVLSCVAAMIAMTGTIITVFFLRYLGAE